MSGEGVLSNRLDRAVDGTRDHVLGPATAPITLVEYGSYDCPHCRAANDRITEVRSEFGDRLRYVFRHRPVTGSDIARRAAELVEYATDPEMFWDAHVSLMTRSTTLTEEDLREVAAKLNVASEDEGAAEDAAERVKARVDQDVASA
ncbi:MAG TPA: thioredoxin domain-containing protein, partial [Burkholderiales bacterium]|nr:thioredoxin domain-containing protein [Burkholderiales bacterium]